ncbi:MAG: tRNA lysidine(34) synthetase TilS [Anaerolineales bacterium]|nr:tRNA lysidine(34) synthetase TilS [Anaerolineales bacterium]
MPADILEIVQRYIRRKALFDPGGRILAAVSGGADSLCLLLVLDRLGYPLHIAHFDHGLRPESGAEADTVRRTAESLGIPFTLGRGDVRRHAEEKRMNLEEAARGLRYEFLNRTGREIQAAVIAVGHTMDDQAETVLLHLLRGSGIRGLGGIRPVASVPGRPGESLRIVRPLLCLTHRQTTDYCRAEGWVPLEDSSNLDPAFTRNRIRLELLPLLKTYNGSVVERLFRLSEIAQDQEDYLDRATEEIWRRSASIRDAGVVRIPRSVFADAHPALQQALVRRAVHELRGKLADLAHRHVEQAVAFQRSPSASRRIDLALGVKVSVEAGDLVFRAEPAAPSEPDWDGSELPIPGSISTRAPDWTFDVSLGEGESCSAPDPWTVWLDAGRLKPPLTLRRRRAGDRFSPAGMPGPVKLNDFLASHHLGLGERDRWPLVCDADGIIWIPGFRLKAEVGSSAGSPKSIRIHVERS